MKVLLIRHGVAQDPISGQSDETRQLTRDGRQALLDQAVYLAIYLFQDDVRLISSPLIRAVQTAEILAAAGLGPIEIQDYVQSGDFETFRQEVLGSPDRTLVIVGHSPHLEDWIQRVTDQSFQLKKGSCVQLEIQDELEFKGYVEWCLRLKEFRKLMRLERSGEALSCFEHDIGLVIRRSVRTILEHREAFLKDPAEIESVHKLRVKIRQFRSLISFFKPLMSKKNQRRIQQLLRQMAGECAYLRELDVLMIEWRKHQESFDLAGESGDEFFEILKSERAAEQHRLFQSLEKPGFAEDLNRVEEQLKGAVRIKRAAHSSLDFMVRETLDRWIREIQGIYESINQNDLAAIHALRIKAKKIRYLMEIFGLSEVQPIKDHYKDIKRWQETLGELTDANRNSEAVREISAKFPGRPIVQEIEIFTRIQEKRAEELFQEFFQSRLLSLSSAAEPDRLVK